jgi:hypothetical protein
LYAQIAIRSGGCPPPAWAQILLRLEAYAESGRPEPFFDF